MNNLKIEFFIFGVGIFLIIMTCINYYFEKVNRNKLKSFLNQLDALCNKRRDTGGLIKRIDENRELLWLIKNHAPDFLESNKWVIGWIRANDEFFTQLDELVKARGRLPDYPRPFPIINFLTKGI